MHSNRCGLDDFDTKELDIPAEVPDFARAWESDVASSVRRPSTLPDPQSYHEAIDRLAIFALDETQKNGSIDTILVVPRSCERCRSLKQTCSRARPTCSRCKKSNTQCKTDPEGGYQRLPRFKCQKSSVGRNIASTSVKEPATAQSRTKRVTSESKRPLSPGSDSVPPRKKIKTKTKPRTGRRRRCIMDTSDSDEVDTECESGMNPSAQVAPTVASTGKLGDVEWTFVNNPRVQQKKSLREEERAHSEVMPPDTLIPRVWTNSLEGFLMVFPELAKTPVGFSWFQFEIPVLLLDTNYARGHWINSTTLSVDFLWDFLIPEDCAHLYPSQSPSSSKSSQPAIPLTTPPEVETLLNSQRQLIPLLLWLSRDSELVTSKPPPEYGYMCMGLFFISDVHHAMIQPEVTSAPGLGQGRVCWSVTLQWAPGGEDALFTISSAGATEEPTPLCPSRNLLNPWWLNEAEDAVSPDDDTKTDRPRDSRMQVFSCIPLDFLAEFHPSESFPRGWFCKLCGMINMQAFFRHQICQSTACGSTHDKRDLQGKVESLSSLRDPHQASTLLRPRDDFPSVINAHCTTWDDGIQSWCYDIKDDVSLCHVFTGNQEPLQGDATALLESIQREVPLRKEHSSSPYFVHTTRLSHLSDGSGAKVPTETPDCVRVAYYTLCDFVGRYKETDRPRFGEIRIQAWINSGSKKGMLIRARKSPAVIHCLGSEVGLKFIPKGGCHNIAESTTADKGKGRAKDENETAPVPVEPCAGPSRHPEQDCGNQASFISKSEQGELLTLSNDVDKSAATDMVQHCGSLDAGSFAVTDLNADTPCLEVASHNSFKTKKGRVPKKDKVGKGKSKASVRDISVTLVHGDCVVVYGDEFECQIVRFGTTILVIGSPEM